MTSIRVYYGEMAELNRLHKKSDAVSRPSSRSHSASQQTGLWLRQLLALELSVPTHELEFIYGENGKPGLAKHPISFNLAHTCQTFALAVSQDLPALGIDIESSARQLRNPAAFAEACLDLATLKQWQQLSVEEQPIFLIRHWVRREAVVKATGAGLAHGWLVSIPTDEALLADKKILCTHYQLGQYYLALAWPADSNKNPAIEWRALGTEWPLITL